MHDQPQFASVFPAPLQSFLGIFDFVHPSPPFFHQRVGMAEDGGMCNFKKDPKGFVIAMN